MKKFKIFLSVLTAVFISTGIVWAANFISTINLDGTQNQTFSGGTNISVGNSGGGAHTIQFSGILGLSNGGTGRSSFTAGSVLFSSGASISQDNSNLFWDDPNNRLGIGTNTPSFRLDIQDGQINTSGGLCISGDCKTSWGSVASGSINFLAKFTGVTSIGNSLLLDNGTNVGIGTTSPAFKLDINGDVGATQVKTNIISATGTNQSVSLNPTGTGRVLVGGDSLVVASKSSAPSSPVTGQIYFDSALGTFRGYNGTSWTSFGQPVAPQPHIMTAVGNAQIDTAQSKFGGASGLFDGTGDWLTTPDNADWTPFNGDFSIDFWVRFNAAITSNLILTQRVTNSDMWNLSVNANAGNHIVLNQQASGNDVINLQASVAAWNTGQWYHIAVVQTGTTRKIFLDGVSQTLDINTYGAIADLAAQLTIAGNTNQDVGFPLNGWLEELRISKGTNLIGTDDFTPPASAYTKDTNTVLLLHMNGTDGSTVFTDGD